MDEVRKAEALNKLSQATVDLIDIISRKMTHAARDIMRATLIPATMSGSDMITFFEKLQEV